MSESIPTEEDTLKDRLRDLQEEYQKEVEPVLRRIAEIQAEQGVDRPLKDVADSGFSVVSPRQLAVIGRRALDEFRSGNRIK